MSAQRDQECAEWYKAGHSIYDISMIVGRDSSSVRRAILRCGITLRHHCAPNPGAVLKMRKNLLRKRLCRQIEKEAEQA